MFNISKMKTESAEQFATFNADVRTFPETKPKVIERNIVF